MLQVIEDGGYTRGMTERMRELEAREDELNEILTAEPVDSLDLHPGVAEVYRRKVERLAEALNAPEDRAEASAALRTVIEKIVLTHGDVVVRGADEEARRSCVGGRAGGCLAIARIVGCGDRI